jgi:acyl-CoA dehydrogenase
VDFTPSDEEQAISDLTARILGDRSTHERLKELMVADDHVDTETWALLARSGVVGASLPEAHGGAGLGFVAVAMALEQVGRFASPVPLLSSTVMVAMAIAEFGTPEQRSAWLPGLADGSLIGAAALAEAGAAATEPQAVAIIGGEGHRLEGTSVLVADGLAANLLLVTARLPDGSVGLFLVEPENKGVDRRRVDTTTGHPDARLELDGVEVTPGVQLGGPSADGRQIVQFIEQRATVGTCMMMSGAARASIEMAADYTKERQQFGRPIATFQAVTQRAGDSYIDAEAITLTAYQAAWRIDQGLAASRAVSIAKYWASEAGFRAVHAAMHVHGGVGVDRDYPLHRYFLLARKLELTLGNAEEHLAELGRSLAADG